MVYFQGGVTYMTIIIKNGRVWDGEKFFLADVLSENGIITKIEENISVASDYVYDAEGKTVSCGFVDIHTHMRGISPDIYGIQAEMSAFPFGVTAAADSGAISGDEGLLDLFALKSYVFPIGEIINNRLNRKKLDEALLRYGRRAVGVKIAFDSASPEITSISALEDVCEYARERSLPVTVHTTGSPASMADIVKTLSKGDILTHAYHGGKNNSAEDSFECLFFAREKGIVVDSGFAGGVHTDFEILKKAISLGALPDTLSTDITCASAYKRGGRYGMTMCMSLAKASGMEEEDILRAVTSTPARVLGINGGSLKVGCVADVTVLSYCGEGFSLVDKAGNVAESDMGYRCYLTLSDGQVVYRC